MVLENNKDNIKSKLYIHHRIQRQIIDNAVYWFIYLSDVRVQLLICAVLESYDLLAIVSVCLSIFLGLRTDSRLGVKLNTFYVIAM